MEAAYGVPAYGVQELDQSQALRPFRYASTDVTLTFVAFQRYVTHNIKCGYCGSILTVDTQEQILCHNCFQKYDEERHAISINEDFVAIIVEASNEIVSEDTSNEQYSTDHRDEMLINIVQTKPALWNFQIPLRERTKAKKKALWKEVENMLGVNFVYGYRALDYG
ncbi:uncharacterized protein LOC116853455 isoform X3 [Odontomachus brunneus]|uniref:uncharacterized protein LOC116852827 isoform X3 n=1 Tax=Odontomachus brunneus TaxID=486640 RepID=UPI0013F27A22|nr:uncharacterized protein LOC116852827 isoform X3 [Odontomachus brunneus]XP_032690453.1 uncharacterized protein LOC116853455 isoform X3 [Odontomachus brunneus]